MGWQAERRAELADKLTMTAALMWLFSDQWQVRSSAGELIDLYELWLRTRSWHTIIVLDQVGYGVVQVRTLKGRPLKHVAQLEHTRSAAKALQVPQPHSEADRDRWAASYGILPSPLARLLCELFQCGVVRGSCKVHTQLYKPIPRFYGDVLSNQLEQAPDPGFGWPGVER